jgi:type IV secretory pathway VirB3-like protein
MRDKKYWLLLSFMLALSLFSGYGQLVSFYLAHIPPVVVPMLRDGLFVVAVAYSLTRIVKSKRMLSELRHFPLFLLLVIPSFYDSSFSAQAIRNIFGPLVLALLLIPIDAHALAEPPRVQLIYKAFYIFLALIFLEFGLAYFLNIDTVAILGPMLEQKNSKVNYEGGILTAARVATPHLSPSTGGVAAAGILLLIMQNRLSRGWRALFFKGIVPPLVALVTVGKSVPFAYLYVLRRMGRISMLLGVVLLLVLVVMIVTGNIPYADQFDLAIHLASLGQHFTGLTSGLDSVASHPFGMGIGRVCIVGINSTGIDRELGNESGIGCLAASSGIAGLYSLLILFGVMLRRKMYVLIIFITIVLLFNENALAPYVFFPLLLADLLTSALDAEQTEQAVASSEEELQIRSLGNNET